LQQFIEMKPLDCLVFNTMQLISQQFVRDLYFYANTDALATVALPHYEAVCRRSEACNTYFFTALIDDALNYWPGNEFDATFRNRMRRQHFGRSGIMPSVFHEKLNKECSRSDCWSVIALPNKLLRVVERCW